MTVAHRLLICGTGTGVGKTHVTRALVHALRTQDRQCVALKPIESGGPDTVADHTLIAAGGDSIPPLYSFSEPLSPHLAAQRAGRLIELSRVAAWVDDHADATEWLLVETAGGLFSPLAPEATNYELVLALQPQALVLVVPDRLGCFHDVIACLRAAGEVTANAFLALSAAPPSDASTGLNAGELAVLGYSRPVWAFPPGDPADAASRAVAADLLAAISASLDTV